MVISAGARPLCFRFESLPAAQWNTFIHPRCIMRIVFTRGSERVCEPIDSTHHRRIYAGNMRLSHSLSLCQPRTRHARKNKKPNTHKCSPPPSHLQPSRCAGLGETKPRGQSGRASDNPQLRWFALWKTHTCKAPMQWDVAAEISRQIVSRSTVITCHGTVRARDMQQQKMQADRQIIVESQYSSVYR